LDSVIEPEGNQAVAVRYRPNGVGWSAGFVESIEHHGRQNYFSWWNEGTTVGITSEGEGTRWMVHDDAGRLTKLQAPAELPKIGLITTYGYNDSGLVDSITTGGSTTSMAFDAHGRLLARTVPLSDTTSATTWFTYSSIHTDPLDPRFLLPVEIRDPRSNGPEDDRFLTQFAYDEHGRVMFESGPRYDLEGNMVVRANCGRGRKRPTRPSSGNHCWWPPEHVVLLQPSWRSASCDHRLSG
jgi:YD repeat-containing protein